MRKKQTFGIPEKIRIGGLTCTVEWVDELERDREVTFGAYSISESKIYLSQKEIKSQDFAELVFVHELLHAMLAQTSVPYTRDIKDPEELEEHLVRSLAPVLLSVIKEL